MTNSEKNIISCAKLIRNEIKNSNYRMPWPPSTHDLNVNSFIPPVSLNLFLTNLITSEEVNERISRLISSFNQDIFFIVHCGKILTRKSILLSLHIKSLCNNKELITIVSRLGHGVSYKNYWKSVLKLLILKQKNKLIIYFVCLKNFKRICFQLL